jgi:hypothetical protein
MMRRANGDRESTPCLTNVLDQTVTTTGGESFTGSDSATLAYQVWRRFGRHDMDALSAWQRMLQNSSPLQDFMELVREGERIEEQREYTLRRVYG